MRLDLARRVEEVLKRDPELPRKTQRDVSPWNPTPVQVLGERVLSEAKLAGDFPLCF